MIYWILIGIVVLCVPLHKHRNFRSSRRNYEQMKKQKYPLYYFYAMSFVLIAVSGLRSNVVGTDTSMYEILFNNGKLITLKEALTNSSVEPGYIIFEHISGLVFQNYQWFLIIIAIITIIPVTIVIYKYSEKPWMSYFLFITFGYFPFFMTGIRQSIAIGITFVAFIFVKKKKLILFLVCIGLACTFHITAIVFLPIYWLDRIELNQKSMIAVSVFIVMSFVFRQSLFQILNKYSRQSYSSLPEGGEKMYIFMLLSIILGFIYYKEFREQNVNNKVFLYMIIVSAVIWPIVSINPALFRLYYYYNIFIIIFVPNLIVSIKDRESKFILTVGFLLVGIYYLITQVITSQLNYYPYYFFWK